ncbi:hypothetical protein EV182_000056 [Spiromyces aspiralis]|uniref:Uncharacterized protein n=1 Tax=Spiromyces aspiralis TaxID=68401 RepID=A0ACC1HVS3_9FUNG|nr:hypothetical protein EV182_000056 [Spiromyces aspiralis]
MNDLPTILDSLFQEGMKGPPVSASSIRRLGLLSSSNPAPTSSATRSAPPSRPATSHGGHGNACATTRGARDHLNLPILPSPLGGDKSSPQQQLAVAFYGDDDADDPRWKAFMHRFFINDVDTNHDDMLFFVRPMSQSANAYRSTTTTTSSSSSSLVSDSGCSSSGGTSDKTKGSSFEKQSVAGTIASSLDPVFVLRKQPPPNILPPLPCPIMWKETFFLNLIVQMPCKLTVAVCRRQAPRHPGGGSPRTVVRKQISKRVYALPNRSRVDGPKDDIGPPECSWPLIYYVIDDYEDMFEDVIVENGEYLCVELSARMPVGALSSPHNNDVPATDASVPSSFTSPPISNKLSDRLDLFDEKRGMWYDRPSAPNSFSNTGSRLNSAKSRLGSARSTYSTGTSHRHSARGTKVVLFQGAASYSALMDNYFTRIRPKNLLSRLRKPVYPTEYIMMRGPSGKGYAQVAVTGMQHAHEDVPQRPSDDASSNSEAMVTSPDPKCRKVVLVSSSSRRKSDPFQPNPPEKESSVQPPRSLASLQAHQHYTSPRPLAESRTSPADPNAAKSRLSPRLNQATSTPLLSGWFKKWSLQAIAGNFAQAAAPPPPPKSIQCCMTFVSIPWTSIIHDLYAFRDRLGEYQ